MNRLEIYLTIITTVLILTQIIRLTQNAKQLKHLHKIHKYDDYILSVYKKLDKALDLYYEENSRKKNIRQYNVKNLKDASRESHFNFRTKEDDDYFKGAE